MQDGTMFIDLASFSIESQGDILSVIPHEINHQIYSQTVPDTTYSVIKRVVDEGFACYINNKFFKGNETVAESLYYSEEDYQYCLKNEQEIFQTIKEIYKSTDRDTVNSFANRGIRLREDYPTAIGYFIGYRIVEEYVKRNGPDSWKEIYDLVPESVLKESRIID